MTVIHLASAASLACVATFVFALLTWRRALARRALILGLAGLLLIVALSYENQIISRTGLAGPTATFWQQP